MLPTSRLRIFESNVDALIEQCTALMANTVMGDKGLKIDNFFACPIFSDNEDLAYLQGSRIAKSLRLGHFGMQQMNRRFGQALSNHGLSGMEVDLQMAQFMVYYWSMTICLTYGKDRKRAYKKARKSRSIVEELRRQADVCPTYAR